MRPEIRWSRAARDQPWSQAKHGMFQMAEVVTSRPVPFAVPDIDDDDIDAVTQVLRSGWITSGSQCAELEGLASALRA